MLIAARVKAEFETKTNKKLTLQQIADQFPHVTSQGVGTKTFIFMSDGSHLRVSGRGRYFRLEVHEAGQQAA